MSYFNLERAKRLLTEAHLECPENELFFLGLRGTRWVESAGELTHIERRLNHFDDTFFVVHFRDEVLEGWPADCGTPSPYWFRHRAYSDPGWGAPFTDPCQAAYVRGLHQGRHEAFRQESSGRGRLKVWRDFDQDGERDESDAYFYPNDTGINIHSAYGRTELVGRASGGCHVIAGGWTGRRWRRLHSLAYVQYRQRRYWYAVLPGAWNKHPADRLLMGSTGERVRSLQTMLGIDADGLFGPETDRAVRAWQRQQAMAPTGVLVNWQGGDHAGPSGPASRYRLVYGDRAAPIHLLDITGDGEPDGVIRVRDLEMLGFQIDAGGFPTVTMSASGDGA